MSCIRHAWSGIRRAISGRGAPSLSANHSMAEISTSWVISSRVSSSRGLFIQLMSLGSAGRAGTISPIQRAAPRCRVAVNPPLDKALPRRCWSGPRRARSARRSYPEPLWFIALCRKASVFTEKMLCCVAATIPSNSSRDDLIPVDEMANSHENLIIIGLVAPIRNQPIALSILT